MTRAWRTHRVVEQFVAAKRAGVVSEDIACDLGTFVVLLDGITSTDGATYAGLTGGRFAAETVLAAWAGLSPEVSAGVALDAVTAALHEAVVTAAGVFPANPPGVVLAVYSPARGEVWRVGDIHVRLGGVHLPTEAPPTDAIATSFRAALLEAYLAGGATPESLIADDPSWSAMLPLLSRQHMFANLDEAHPLGYGVVNGTTVPARHLQVHPVAPGTEVVLASDGYFSADGDLAAAEAAIAHALATDPLLIRGYQGFRPAQAGGSFDDRCWIRFTTAL